jgi:hypothetical protein
MRLRLERRLRDAAEFELAGAGAGADERVAVFSAKAPPRD